MLLWINTLVSSAGKCYTLNSAADCMSLNLQTPCLRTTAKDVLWYVIHVTGFLNARIKGSTFCFDLARTPRTRELTQPPNSKDPCGNCRNSRLSSSLHPSHTADCDVWRWRGNVITVGKEGNTPGRPVSFLKTTVHFCWVHLLATLGCLKSLSLCVSLNF